MMRLVEKFAPPWTMRPTQDGFAVDCADGPTVAHVHLVDGNSLLSQEEARSVASAIARLPVLLTRPRY